MMSQIVLRQIGQSAPWLSTMSVAHSKQTHMWPHLYSTQLTGRSKQTAHSVFALFSLSSSSFDSGVVAVAVAPITAGGAQRGASGGVAAACPTRVGMRGGGSPPGTTPGCGGRDGADGADGDLYCFGGSDGGAVDVDDADTVVVGVIRRGGGRGGGVRDEAVGGRETVSRLGGTARGDRPSAWLG